MIHTNTARLVGANVLVAAIFALLFYEQGIAFPSDGAGLTLLGVWAALFLYSAIIFTALFLLAFKGLKTVPAGRFIKAGLAWLSAFVVSLPGVSFMTVSVESFLGELDPAPVGAGAGIVTEFTQFWFMEAIDIGPTAALFFVALTGAAYLFGGLQLGTGTLPRTGSAEDGPTAAPGQTIPNLKNRIVWALQADEHYVQVHGPRTSQQVLGRLKDAIADASGLDGMQVHRSWWVAQDGIAGIETDAKQVVILLKNGTKIPVSQRRAKAFLDWHKPAATASGD